MSQQGFSIKGAAERERTPSFSSKAKASSESPSKTLSRRSRSLVASKEGETSQGPDDAPPLPGEPLPNPSSQQEAPPLPSEPVPAPVEAPVEDDGWEPHLDPATGHWYFTNRFTGVSQWENPRVPTETYIPTALPVYSGAPGTESYAAAPGTTSEAEPPRELYLGYNPKIHGDYDPNADYAKWHEPAPAQVETVDVVDTSNLIGSYEQAGTFNRRTGAFQGAGQSAEHHNDENKSKRQMNAFFDVDLAANLHDGRSLKAERANKKMSKEQVKAFNEQRRAKKEQKRRDFLMS